MKDLFFKHCFYKFLFNSICVNGCYLQCEESHPNMMDGNDENILSSMKWNQTVNWRKVHTKSFSYMFLCKLWELVKHGTNDNSFEYVKRIHLNMIEMKKINEWDKACILWRDFFYWREEQAWKKTWPPYCLNPLQETFFNVSQNEK
jgi:hypothetical protein